LALTYRAHAYSFSFQSSVDHRLLHSFPTRRSSDLSVVRSWKLSITTTSCLPRGSRIALCFRASASISSTDSANSAPSSLKFLTEDRKSTCLNSSHVKISYAVFCLKKKKMTQETAAQ